MPLQKPFRRSRADLFWIVASTLSALIGGAILSHSITLVELDHAVCFAKLGLPPGSDLEVAAQVAIDPRFLLVGSLHFLPYLLGTLTPSKPARRVWGAGSLLLLALTSTILLRDPSRLHDCDRKGLEFDVLLSTFSYPLLPNLIIILACLIFLRTKFAR